MNVLVPNRYGVLVSPWQLYLRQEIRLPKSDLGDLAAVKMFDLCCFVLPVQVSLVLEYCDWGSLRTALDAGAFFAGEAWFCMCIIW